MHPARTDERAASSGPPRARGRRKRLAAAATLTRTRAGLMNGSAAVLASLFRPAEPVLLEAILKHSQADSELPGGPGSIAAVGAKSISIACRSMSLNSTGRADPLLVMGRSSGLIASSHRIAARSMAFSSSRTLPGQP